MGMGRMESESARRAQRTRIRDIVLLSLYGAGALTLAMAAPNAVRLLKYVEPETAHKRRAEYRIKEALGRALRRGDVVRDRRGKYSLTRRGLLRAERVRLMTQEPEQWDGKWRVVIFDVWESRRKVRNRLRLLLLEKGFLRLQDSVWVYPYPCEEFVVLLRAELKLGGALVYIIADSIDNERHLKREFGLPS
jgi:CRISPR/Cas system-associated endoribonuclease Cas2